MKKTESGFFWLEKAGIYVVLGIVLSLICGCAGTPKVSQWSAPSNLTFERVFNAALRASTDNKFTIVSSDKAAGVISMKRQEYGGDKMVERYLSVKLKQDGNKILVSTRASGSDFGIIEGALGGSVNKELTHNFYVYLFRELNIDNPALCRVVITDEN